MDGLTSLKLGSLFICTNRYSVEGPVSFVYTICHVPCRPISHNTMVTLESLLYLVQDVVLSHVGGENINKFCVTNSKSLAETSLSVHPFVELQLELVSLEKEH